ncbi:hypothetical protein HK098_005816, partial [Nowakowskiella sp. JEL0407]
MKLFLTLFCCIAAIIPVRALSFTEGNLVVRRVGTGAAALTSAATSGFLDEYDTTGTKIQSISCSITTSGSATSEGALSLSPNGRYLVYVGYVATAGTASITGTTTTANPRAIGVASPDGTIDETLQITDAFSGNNIRGATTADGNHFWAVGGNSGVRYVTKGSSTTVQITSSST